MRMSGREIGPQVFVVQCWKIELSASMLTFVLSLAYLSLKFEMGTRENFTLAGCMAAGLLVAASIAGGLRHSRSVPIRRYLEDAAGGTARESATADGASAFATILSLPSRMQRAAFLTPCAAIVLVPGLMWTFGFDGWLAAERIKSLVIVLLAASLMSGLVLFYSVKRDFSGLRNELAEVAGDSGARAGLIPRHSIQQKIALAVVIPVLASIGLMLDVLGEKLRFTAETDAVQFASFDWAFGLVCLAVLGLAFWIGRLAASEIGEGIEALEVAAERMAAGDLTSNVVFESEDEIGDANRALASVRDLMRSSVAKISSTADAADLAANEISAAVRELASSNAAQAEQIQQTGVVVAAIAARVDQTNEYAKSLSETIDESGDSLIELGATGDELKETASVLTSKVAAVSDSVEQMVESVRQIAGTSERLTAASEETSSSMEEMASAMRTVDTSAEMTANLSREVVSKAELGQEKVVQTIEGMEAIREATDVAEKVIRGLGTRTHEIGGILDVIDDVADETNLLALNAAIIAAQAGEQGKAFSVVAEEIKELADRVLASTKEIGGLIRAVQDESENAIGAIEAGSASVMSGVDLSAEAGRTLEEITVSSRESGLRISEIVSSVREQTKAASHVVGLMEKVRESAEEIGVAGRQQDAGNEIVSQSALAMREVAQQVHRATEEQTIGLSRIRENVEGVRDAIENITRSLGEQIGDCRQAKEGLGRATREAESNESIAKKMQEAVGDLITQAAVLREDAERFRV